MNTFDLSLDLDKRAGVTQWVTMRQGDHDGTQLRATIYDHGTQVSDSYTCRVSIRKPTDNEYYRETCSFSGGVAIVTIDEQYAASEVGITYGYFELLQGTAVIASTENFGVRILQSAIDGAIVAPPYDSAIEDALAELDEATGRISQMVQDATAEYLEAHPELTTTVEDNSLTDAKLIQKGGILQREQWLETMLPNIPRKATAEADVHSVTDSAGGGPLGIEVYGRSTQDGTPTPDAPVAIVSVGTDSDGGVKLRCTGRNLQPFFSVTPISSAGGYWSGVSSYWTPTSDGWARFTRSVERATNSDIAVLPQVGFEVGQTYTVLLEWRNVSLTGTATMYMQDDTSMQLDTIASTNITAGSGRAYVQTTCLHGPTDAGITRFLHWRTRLQADSSLDGEFRLSIYRGAYDGEYQPYESATIPIDLGGRSLRSLPDGTRDEVVVDEWGHAVLTQRVGSVDLGTLNWAKYAADTSGHSFYASSPSSMAQNQQDQVPPFLCAIYTAAAFGSTINTWVTKDNAICQVAGPYRVIVRDTAQTDAATFKTAMDGITLLYKLATPVTIDLGHLDPALLPAPDLTAYVVPSAPSVLRYGYTVAESTSSNLAPVETSPATASHAAGTLLTLDGQLVKVTSAIAVGEAVTIGGNVRTTTIAAELAALA